MNDTDFTSGDIAQAEKPAVEAPPASTTQEKPATADASTTVSPGTTEKPTDQFGPIPWERHELILNNTRRGYEDKLHGLSWAEQLKREEVEQALALRELARRDPAALVQHLSKRSENAPSADARDERGEAFYSPQQAAALARYEVQKAIGELRAELGDRLTPIESERIQSKQYESLSNQIQAASAWPGFGDHLDAITEAIAQANTRREELSLHEAYIKVVAPKLADASATREAELKKKWLAEQWDTSARAKADINPQRLPAATRKPNKDKSFPEIIAETREELRRA